MIVDIAREEAAIIVRIELPNGPVSFRFASPQMARGTARMALARAGAVPSEAARAFLDL